MKSQCDFLLGLEYENTDQTIFSSYPYVAIAAYVGSISTFDTLDKAKPAIYAAIGLTAFFWLSWAVFLWFRKRSRVKHIQFNNKGDK